MMLQPMVQFYNAHLSVTQVYEQFPDWRGAIRFNSSLPGDWQPLDSTDNHASEYSDL